MPDTTAPTIPPGAIRIVLFGLPDAGKSSLLGALAQAAQTQEHLLNGRLKDESQGLTELQNRLYEERPRETLEEILPYPAAFEPFGAAPGTTLKTVFIDCDGRVANEILSRRRSLDDTAETSLAGQVSDADALLLVVDASASPVQMDADFAEFARFLRLLEQSRGRRSAIGGLPVFLVLTKCDLLAKPDDTPAAWMERIEDRKRAVGQRFREFLDEDRSKGPVPFGSIDLRLWATAVKRPALVGSPARPREPYGVAELFRQCLEQAGAFQTRERAAGHRLAWTVGGAATVLLAMTGLAVSFLARSQTTVSTPLETQVQRYQADEGPTASARLREPLQDKISLLTELKSSADFAKLPQPLQDYVNQRLQELEDYQAYKKKLASVQPETVRSEEELEEMRALLEDRVAPPAAYRSEWAQTEAVRLWHQKLTDIKALHATVGRAEDWYRRLKQKGDELWYFTDLRGEGGAAPVPWGQWHERVQQLLDEAKSPPFLKDGAALGSRVVTRETVLGFRSVKAVQKDWEEVARRLETLRGMAAALGLSGAAAERPPSLKVPAKGFALDQATARLDELKEVYPGHADWPKEFADWQDRKLLLPAVAAEVRQAAAASYQHALAPAREAVLRQMQQVSPDGRETPERWRQVADWLAGTRELTDWRRLATLLARLQDVRAEDPVTALIEFLRRDRFELVLDSLTLSVPDDLKVRPIGPLSVFHRRGDEARTEMTFNLRSEGEHDARRRLTRYTFAADGRKAIGYRPGDAMWAELPLNKDAENRARSFAWTGCRSMVYQFERLLKAPRLQREGKDGEVTDRVTLTVLPATGVPPMPDLLPVVILKKQ